MVGSDVSHIASSRLRCHQTLPAAGDQPGSPLPPSRVSLEPWGPAASRVGGRLRSCPLPASEVEGRWDRAVPPCPSSPGGVELMLFAGGSGRAGRSSGSSPRMWSSWARGRVDPNLGFDPTPLPSGGAGSAPGGLFRYPQNVYPLAYFHFSTVITVPQLTRQRPWWQSGSSCRPLVSPWGVETPEHHITPRRPGLGGLFPGSTAGAGRASP